MASLSPNLSSEDIEEEIALVNAQLETLDPDADNFQQAFVELHAKQQQLYSLLEAEDDHQFGASITAGANKANELSADTDSWWKDAAASLRHDVETNSNSGSSAGHSLVEHPSASSSKRPRSSSQFVLDEPIYKRISPNAAGNNPVERVRLRQQAAEAAIRKQQETNIADAAFALDLSQDRHFPSNSSLSSSSSQPRTQTTLSQNGKYHRPPPKSEPASTPPHLEQPLFLPRASTANDRPLLSQSNFATPQASVYYTNQDHSFAQHPHFPSNPAPLPLDSPYSKPEAHNVSQHPPSILQQPKSEPFPSQLHQNFNMPRQSGAVVDLTGSDSDEDIHEVAYRKVAPSAPAPSQLAAQLLYSGQSQPLAQQSYHRSTHQPGFHVPGAYPGSSFNYEYPNVSAVNRAPTVQGQNPLYNGAWFGDWDANGIYDDNDDYNENDDDELVYRGSRQLPSSFGTYSGNEDLYRQRYDALAAYDPTQTREEIQSLLQNIRPDEEMPAHLRVKTPEAMAVNLHKYQELGLTWLQFCEDGSNNGGILADDMGLGKTIQMLSLMVTRKSTDPRCKTTLIVAPVALMRQWKQEIQQKVKSGINHRLTVHIHHGPSKKKDFRDLQLYDVVLTTYGSLAVEAKKMETFRVRQKYDPSAQPRPTEKCPLTGDGARWYRVILDEAQCIKNRSTQTAKGACMVTAKFRWCMTGTPMMNNIEELYSLIRFLQIKPYCQWEKFRLDFKIPLKSPRQDTRDAAMRRLQICCKAVMLRRTKKSTFEGKPILILPERTTDVDNPEFNEDERTFYQAVETKTKLQFNKYLRKGTVGKSYTAILVLLLRLRQACCHPHLLKDFGVSAAADMTEDQLLEMARLLADPVVARIKETDGNFECPVCYDVTPNPAIFIPCGHDTCSECLARLTDPAQAIQNGQDSQEGATRFKCPNCRGPIDSKRLTDFTSFKKVHAPEMLTAQEAAAAEDATEESSDSESDDSSTDNEKSQDGDDEEDSTDSLNDFIVDDETVGNVKSEDEADEEDSDDLDRGVESRSKPTPSVKDEKIENTSPGPSSSAAQSRSKDKERIKKPKDAKGKGKQRQKDGKKKVQATMTLAELKKRGNRNTASRKEYLRRLRKHWISSAKIDKTMNILQEIMAGEEREKVLVFSQWTSLLDLLEVPIDDCGWGYRRYDGSLNARMRGDAVDDFRDANKNIRIMLVSLKAGNAGLNLNMASQVIILDPFWNPFIEEQAIDRAHRIGQARPVKVHRVLVAGTVEDRIIELQEKKRALIAEALDEKASQSISRLGISELNFLFGNTTSLNEQGPIAPFN